MKVKDLIKQLQSCDPEHLVCLPGYEGGYYTPEHVTAVEMTFNVNDKWYYGPHEMYREDEYPDYERGIAVVIA